MTGIADPAATFVLMAMFIAVWLWYVRRIGKGSAGPVIDPSWTTIMRPNTPPPFLHAPETADGRNGSGSAIERCHVEGRTA